MKAIAITAFGGPETLQLLDLTVPNVAADEVLIQNKAAGVGYWDIQVRENIAGISDKLVFPIVLGWECAGVVAAVGQHVEHVVVGDEVFVYAFQRGCYAEYVVAPAHQVARKPRALNFEQAAALPVNGVTAVQAIDALNVQTGEKVLITGAAGGTGVLAVQIAAARGAYVIATASARNVGFLQELGAREVVDYNLGDFAEAICATHPDGMSAVLECVERGDNFWYSLTTLRPGGRMVSIVRWSKDRSLRSDVSVDYLIGQAETRLLNHVAQLVDVGALRPEVQQVFPLQQATQAQRLVQERHTRGRIVLRIG